MQQIYRMSPEDMMPKQMLKREEMAAESAPLMLSSSKRPGGAWRTATTLRYAAGLAYRRRRRARVMPALMARKGK